MDYFRLPGSPHTPVYTGHTTITLDPKENLITDHIETWDIKPDEVTPSSPLQTLLLPPLSNPVPPPSNPSAPR